MPSSQKAEERTTRAGEFARRLAATGLTITEFQRQLGLTRNVIYNLSKGQQPSSPDQEAKIDEAFRRLAK